MVVVVAVVAVLLGLVLLGGFLLPRWVSVPPPQCAGLECSTVFALGGATGSRCPVGDTFATNGCLATHYVYRLTVGGGYVPIGDIRFEVNTPAGSAVIPNGSSGFSLTNGAGTVVAQFAGGMTMEPGWTYSAGTNASTPLTNVYGIVVDMGTADPAGRGYTLFAFLSAPASGTVAVPLP